MMTPASSVTALPSGSIPDADECIDDPNNPDPENLCSVQPGLGYALVTPGQGGQGGNIFSTELVQWENVRVTAQIEMRDWLDRSPGGRHVRRRHRRGGSARSR